MAKPGKDGRGNDAVVVEDGGPGFEYFVGDEDDSALFVALADVLEEQVGAMFVDRHEPDFVDHQDGGPQVLGQFVFQAVIGLGGGGPGGKPGKLGRGQMGFTQADSTEEYNVGFVWPVACASGFRLRRGA